MNVYREKAIEIVGSDPAAVIESLLTSQGSLKEPVSSINRLK
jgi:hypothetical protein